MLRVRLGAEHDHRHSGQPGQDLLPGQPRQHQVQKHQVRAAPGQRQQSFGAGVGP